MEWLKEKGIEVDYFSTFIKAWIAFNSWYRREYIAHRGKIIEKRKAENNHFKDYIETLLEQNNISDEAGDFKKDLRDLQVA